MTDISGPLSLPSLEDGIPERVTLAEMHNAVADYARADKKWKTFAKTRYLSQKEEAGDRLYRLTKAYIRNKVALEQDNQ